MKFSRNGLIGSYCSTGAPEEGPNDAHPSWRSRGRLWCSSVCSGSRSLLLQRNRPGMWQRSET